MTLEALMDLAAEHGALVTEYDGPSGLYVPANTIEENTPPVILLPKTNTREMQEWVLAHELGHLMLGHERGKKPYIILEIEAWHHAKKLIAA